ncbi:pyridoxal phosphate phosphatase PHOSPHO2-like [Glandiceps talaboti]
MSRFGKTLQRGILRQRIYILTTSTTITSRNQGREQIRLNRMLSTKRPARKNKMAQNSGNTRILLVCDFDHTIVDDNCDTYIKILLPNETIPERIRRHYRMHRSWTDFMGEIFQYMQSLKVTPQQIIDCMHSIKFTDGMKELLEYQAKQDNIDFIILSDANMVFIREALEGARLNNDINDIFSNPAKFNDEGCLEIKHYHSHDCDLCPSNMCKKLILKEYREKQHKEGIEYDRVCYVGDGGNDFCPSQSLCESDVVFPRVGYNLIDKITKFKKKGKNFNAKVVPWVSGQEVLDTIKKLI